MHITEQMSEILKLIPLFWTFRDACSVFQNQGGLNASSTSQTVEVFVNNTNLTFLYKTGIEVC